MHQVLQLDIQGTPQAWVTPEEAALHYVTGTVAWEAGDTPLVTLRGGINAISGLQSTLTISPIIATRGKPKKNLHDVVPGVTKAGLIKRDRNTCAYCAQVFKDKDLEAEHIIPDKRGGPRTWLNLVCACSRCNSIKACRTPEEANMQLVYLPYVPSRHEIFILAGRNIRADVHEWLAAKLPKSSRLF